MSAGGSADGAAAGAVDSMHLLILGLVGGLVCIYAAGFLGKRYGMVSVVYSMAFCYAIMSLVHLYQCFLIVNQKTVGVWDK